MILNIPDISLTPAIIARGGPTVYAAKHFVDTANNLLANQVRLAAGNYLVHANVIDRVRTDRQIYLAAGFLLRVAERIRPTGYLPVRGCLRGRDQDRIGYRG
jgi:hypothetical protein